MAPGKKRRLPREALEFQPDAVVVSAGRLPPQARLALYVILAALLFGALWAWFSHVDRVVSAKGMLETQAPPITVQPLETSVIRSINVRAGDVVEKGGLLATLDPTFATAELGRLKERKRFLTAWTARLTAELEGKDYNPDTDDPTPEDKVQRLLFIKRNEELQAKMDAYDLEAAALEDVLEANVNEQARLDKQDKLASEVESMYRQLWSKAKTSRIEYITALKEKLRVEDLYAKAAEKNAQIKERLAQAKAERLAFVSGRRSEIAGQLLEAQQELAEAEHTLSKAARRSELVELRAAADAIVKEVGAFSEGSVIPLAEPLFTLIPIGAEMGALEAEAAIPAKDIGHVQVGADVRMKLTAFPFQRHGFLTGRVRMISPDVFVDDGSSPTISGSAPSGEVYYAARVTLDKVKLRGVGPHFRLLPGMTLTAEILVGKRRVADYLLDPLVKGLHESMSEP